jgi:hypothetical protein
MAANSPKARNLATSLDAALRAAELLLDAFVAPNCNGLSRALDAVRSSRAEDICTVNSEATMVASEAIEATSETAEATSEVNEAEAVKVYQQIIGSSWFNKVSCPDSLHH